MLGARTISGALVVGVFGAITAVACGGGGNNTTTGSGGTSQTTGSGGAGTTTGTGAGPDTTGSTSSSSSSGSTSSSSGTPAGGIFEAPEPWTTPVDQDAKDPESDKIITWLAQNGGWGNGNKFQIDFSITLQYADSSTPKKSFTPTGDFYSPDCDEVPMPVPPGGALEGESGYSCDNDGDCHLLVVDKPNHKLYEMWRAFAPPDPSTFNGGCAVVWDLQKAYPPNLRGEGCTSADAGGFPIAAMLFTADEVAAGHIDHAIRFILPNPRIRDNVYVHPGTHSTGPTSGGPDAPPYGVRFRLKPSFDLAKLPTDGARTVAKALQKYGMFLADAGNIALTAADDRFTNAKWSDANVNLSAQDLYAIQVTDFEVVNLGTPIDWSGDCMRNP
jgi:serine/threonine-protein kinase